MLFFTPAQWLVLGLVLVGGWLLGLASHPGGKKWKARYLAERDAHAANRREAEARAAEWKTRSSELDRQNARVAELEHQNARIAELERENARLASAAPVTAATIRPVEDRRPFDDRRVVPATAARPAYPAGEKRGWFDWGRR